MNDHPETWPRGRSHEVRRPLAAIRRDPARRCPKADRAAGPDETADRTAKQSCPRSRTLPPQWSTEARYNSIRRRASIQGIAVTRLAACANNHALPVGLEFRSRKAPSYSVHCDHNGTRVLTALARLLIRGNH